MSGLGLSLCLLSPVSLRLPRVAFCARPAANVEPFLLPFSSAADNFCCPIRCPAAVSDADRVCLQSIKFAHAKSAGSRSQVRRGSGGLHQEPAFVLQAVRFTCTIGGAGRTCAVRACVSSSALRCSHHPRLN